jgi:hypothetical protein
LKNASTLCNSKKPSFDGFFCILVFIFLFGGLACKKDEAVKPELILYAPVSGQQFRVLDTALVKGRARDAVGITSVEVQLVDADGNPASSRVQEQASGKDFSFSIRLPLDKTWLPSGNYQIEVVARNATGFTRQYVSVSVQEIPRALDAAWVVSGTSQAFQIQRFTNQGLSSPVFWGSGKWLSGRYFPKNGVWMQASNSPLGQGLIEAFELKPQWRRLWSRSFPQPILSALSTDTLLLLGFDNATVVGLRPDGVTGVTTSTLLDGYQTKALVSAPFGGLAALAQASPPYTITGFRIPSGQKLASTTVAQLPAHWINQSANKAYWISGNGNIQTLFLLDCNSLFLQPLVELPGISRVASATNQGDLAIAFDDAIWVYRTNTQVLAPFAALPNATWVRHEDLLGQFWVASQAGIHQVSFPQGVITGPFSAGINVLDFVFQYNK